jgi:myo-inositol-1(or 4)-monophosphatase
MVAMAASHDPETCRQVAGRLATLGGRAALARLGAGVVERKADQSPITEVDHAVQALILDELAAAFPRDAILVEERVAARHEFASAAEAEHCWVIDPIDGTRNFARGLPLFATSVALLQGGRPVAGAIFDASTGFVYTARAGGGSFCGERRLQLDDPPIDPDTTLAISSLRFHPRPERLLPLLRTLLIRNAGAACLHLAWAAAGRIDCVYGPDFKLWDVAAGALRVQEAGGVVTDGSGRACWPADTTPADAGFPVLAGRPRVHGYVLKQLADV